MLTSINLVNLIAKVSFSIGKLNIHLDNFVLASFVVILLILLLRWGIRKTISFVVVELILASLMFLTDTRITNFLAEGHYLTTLYRPLFLFAMGFVFIYYAFIRKDP